MLKTIIDTAVNPALELLPASMDTRDARVMLLAIGLQESRFLHRRQIGGPARGFWQFEKGGGVTGVLTHSATKAHAMKVCEARAVEPTSQAVYNALETDDVLAAAFARLLLWSDPKKMPDNSADGWLLYLRTWRPGRPHPETWPDLYARAIEAAA